ncbi:MAG TPA: 5'-3' exonuclease H3TH domain-containing protein [Acidimicrobiales bacterium]|nr:5'-3' exonuclease H3TH domain-containing protein [Acidimicrobiales bacterium]
MRIHLVDGTYELFRHYYSPSATHPDVTESRATRGVLGTIVGMLADGATHIGVATDHVVESFRNKMWRGYKTSAGMPPDLLAQFPLLEEAVAALGVVVWPMTDLEADDALASAAAVGHDDTSVDQVAIWTPDKDLAQCVRGTRVVQVDRRSGKVIDDDGVRAKFGVPPESIPDYLALVGDSADGFPGIPGWGAKSTATVLAHYGHIESIPAAAGQWEVGVRNSGSLAAALVEQMEHALLFRDLATLRVDRSLLADADALRWKGPTAALEDMCARLDAANLLDRVARLGSGEA